MIKKLLIIGVKFIAVNFLLSNFRCSIACEDVFVAPDLAANVFYTDKSMSKIDESVFHENKNKLRDVDLAIKKIGIIAERYFSGNFDGDCFKKVLNDLHDNNSLAGVMVGPQAKVERLWRFVPLIIYIYRYNNKNKCYNFNDCRYIDWVRRVSSAVNRDFFVFDNNLKSWSILVDAIKNKITGDANDGLEYVYAVNRIDLSGIIGSELNRGDMVAHYHKFYVMPLIVSCMVIYINECRDGDLFKKIVYADRVFYGENQLSTYIFDLSIIFYRSCMLGEKIYFSYGVFGVDPLGNILFLCGN